jgi:uncharacterized membrane protein YvbJ
LVYCSKCGTQNEDNAIDCVNCKAPLHSTRPERSYRSRDKRKEDECFGLPGGGAILGLFIGAIIIIVGLQQVLRININFGPFAIIIFGLLVVAGAIYGLTRRNN